MCIGGEEVLDAVSGAVDGKILGLNSTCWAKFIEYYLCPYGG